MPIEPSQLPIEREYLLDLAEKYETPSYITNAEIIEDRYTEVEQAFSDASVYYSAKANTNPHILKLLSDLGSGMDAVSLGELIAGERSGFRKEKMMYTAVNPPERELRGAAERGVRINIDSEMELERLSSIRDEIKIEDIGVRVDPGVGAGHSKEVITGGGTKFGVRDPVRVCKKALDLGLDISGLHMHIGSGIVETDPYIEAVESLVSIIWELKELGIDLKYVDIGGGFGIPYKPGEKEIDLETLSSEIYNVYDLESELIVEPGRYLVADSTVFLTKVNTVKERFIGVDAGFNIFPRPALYGSYHHVTNISRDAESKSVHVVGPLCESGDILAENRSIDSPERGDILAFHTAGAYCFSMASNYNSTLRPPEILVSGDTDRLIRERENYEDLFKNVT